MFFEIGYNVGLVLTNRAKKSQIFSLWPLCFLRNIHVFGCTFLVFYIPESSDPKYCARIACFRRLDGRDGTKRGPRSSSYHKRATVLWKKNRSFLPRVACSRRSDSGERCKVSFSLLHTALHYLNAWNRLCREWSSREATWREARSSQSAILFLFIFLGALKET